MNLPFEETDTSIASLDNAIVLAQMLIPVLLKLVGDDRMGKIITKIIALIQSILEYFGKERERKVQELKQKQEQVKKEIEVEREEIKKKLEESGYSADAFGDALDRVRDLQDKA